jgi:hypothetical protein
MCTVFPEGKVAPILCDEVTSVAPSRTRKVMLRPIRPVPGITRSKTNRPSGLVVAVCWLKILGPPCPKESRRGTLISIGAFAAGVFPTRKVPSTRDHGSRWMIRADHSGVAVMCAKPEGCVITSWKPLSCAGKWKRPDSSVSTRWQNVPFSLTSPFLTWICDPSIPRATLAPTAGRLCGVTTFATISFPRFSAKSIAMVPSLLLMSRETAA